MQGQSQKRDQNSKLYLRGRICCNKVKTSERSLRKVSKSSYVEKMWERERLLCCEEEL